MSVFSPPLFVLVFLYSGKYNMNADDTGETQQIHEWILSYTCYAALVNFSRNGDIGINRDFVQG